MEQYRITERQLTRLNEIAKELARHANLTASPLLAEVFSLSEVIRSTQVLEWMKVTRDASGRWEEA